MLCYAICVQAILLATTGTWRNVLDNFGSGCAALLAMGADATAALANRERLLDWMTTAPRDALLLVPTATEAAAFIWPRAIALTVCSVLGLGIRLATSVLRNGFPEEGFALSRTPRGAVGEKRE